MPEKGKKYGPAPMVKISTQPLKPQFLSRIFNLRKNFVLRNCNKKIDRHIPCDLSFQTRYIDVN